MIWVNPLTIIRIFSLLTTFVNLILHIGITFVLIKRLCFAFNCGINLIIFIYIKLSISLYAAAFYAAPFIKWRRAFFIKVGFVLNFVLKLKLLLKRLVLNVKLLNAVGQWKFLLSPLISFANNCYLQLLIF